MNADFESICALLQEQPPVNILCIGDIMLDKFVYGCVERISPEAPVPIFLTKKENVMLGGAGNVAFNLSSLGCETTFIGVTGRDKNSCLLSQMLNRAKIKNHLFKFDGLITTVKTRLIANNQHLLRVDNEDKYIIPKVIIPRVIAKLKKLISRHDVVVLSDYNKGIFTIDSCQAVINICNDLNKKVLIDPKGDNYEKYQGAYLVKPNLKEFCNVTKLCSIEPSSPTFYSEIHDAAQNLFSSHKIKNLVVTLGEHGMLYMSAGSDTVYHVPTNAKEVYDVSGAGDTALATLAMCIAKGFDLQNSVTLANIASGLVISKLGTAVITKNELIAELKASS